MGGVVARGNWESSRGMRAPRASHSPGANSNMSMATTASSERRTKKAATSSNKSRSSASPRPTQSDDELVSDEGSLTETEKATLVGKPGMTQGSFTTFHHPHHRYQGSSSYRRTKGKGSGRIARTPSASNTPTLQDPTDSPRK